MSDLALLHDASLDAPIVLVRRESNYRIDGVGANRGLSVLLLGYTRRGHRGIRAGGRHAICFWSWWAAQWGRVAELWRVSL